jgi:hypothetical protein
MGDLKFEPEIRAALAGTPDRKNLDLFFSGRRTRLTRRRLRSHDESAARVSKRELVSLGGFGGMK